MASKVSEKKTASAHGAWKTEAYKDSDENEMNLLKAQAIGYAQATSIHGFAYLGEEGRAIIER